MKASWRGLRNFIEVDNHNAVDVGGHASRYQVDPGEETAVQRCVSRGGYQRRRRRIDLGS